MVQFGTVDRQEFIVTMLTIADLLDELGGIPAARVRLKPLPGTATVSDVIDVEARENKLCELVDGVLVEKPMGIRESFLAARLIVRLGAFVEAMKLGLVAGEGGMLQLREALVRIPDVAFIAWAKLRGQRKPPEAAPLIAPNLAVEIISPSNTKREMARKLREYFDAGTELVWYVDPDTRTISVYTGLGDPMVLGESDVLDGGAVLPGFTLRLGELFEVLDQLGDGPQPNTPS